MSYPVQLGKHPDFLRRLPVPPDPVTTTPFRNDGLMPIGVRMAQVDLARQKKQTSTHERPTHVLGVPLADASNDDSLLKIKGRPVSCTCGLCRKCYTRAWFRINAKKRNAERRALAAKRREKR